MIHPFEGIIEPATTDIVSHDPDKSAIQPAVSRRGILGFAAASLTAGATLFTQTPLANAQQRGRGNDRDRDDDGGRRRDDDDNHRRRRNRGRSRRDREREEWYNRLDEYYFGRNLWGDDHNYRRRQRGRYTTQALYEEGGRGRWNRGRYDRRYNWRYRRDGWNRWNRWDGRHRDRDRDQRRRYTTYALGEEG